MPTVPRLTNTSVEGTVGDSYVMPGAPSSAFAHASDVAGAIGKLGETINDIGLKMRDQQDAQAVFDASMKTKSFTLDQQRQARELTGENARGISEKYGEAWKKNREEIASKLTPRQRRLFDNEADNIGLQHTDMLARHEWTQNRHALETSAVADMEMSRKIASNNPEDMGAITGARANIESKTAFLAAQNGWSKEQTDLKRSEEVSKLHVDVVESLINSRPLMAKDYFKNVKTEIDVDARARIEKALDISSARQQAQDWADKTFSKDMPEDQALEATRKRFKDEQEREAALKAVKERYVEDDAIKKHEQEKGNDAGWKTAVATGKLPPPTIFSAMSGHQQAVLKNWLEATKNGMKVKTDLRVYNDLMELAARDPESFATHVDVNDFRDKLDDGDFKDISRLHASAIKGEMKPLHDAATLDQQMAADIPPDMQGNDEVSKTKRGAFRKYVRQQVDAIQTQTGKLLGIPERQEIIDQALKQGSRERQLWTDKTMRAFELKPEEIDLFTPPPEMLADFAKRFNVPNDKTLLQKYRQALKEHRPFAPRVRAPTEGLPRASFR